MDPVVGRKAPARCCGMTLVAGAELGDSACDGLDLDLV